MVSRNGCKPVWHDWSRVTDDDRPERNRKNEIWRLEICS